MNTHSATFVIFFGLAFVEGYTLAAILLLSVAAILIRKRRRTLMASVSTLSWIVVVTGVGSGLAYVSEPLIAWFGGNPYERYLLVRTRFLGPYAWDFWLTSIVNIAGPQLFWFRPFRRNAFWSLLASVVILIPMNVERIVSIFTAKSDFFPSFWK